MILLMQDLAEPVVVDYEEMRAYDVASQYMSIQKTKNRKKKNKKTKYGWWLANQSVVYVVTCNHWRNLNERGIEIL